MIKSRYLLVLMAIVIISLVGCAENQISVGIGETFTIGVGDSARISNEDMEITFNEVIGDSRCPQNVTCVWEGVASSKVTIAYLGVNYVLALNEPGLTDQAKETFRNYTLTYSLNPYPREGESIAANDYRLTMTVSK
jgi:hypothetical protein